MLENGYFTTSPDHAGSGLKSYIFYLLQRRFCQFFLQALSGPPFLAAGPARAHTCGMNQDTSPLPPPPASGTGLPSLMASLAGALGGPGLPAPPLPGLGAALEACQTLILLVVDGLGEAQLQRHLPGGILARQRFCSLESVFPSTTASAVGTLLTGLAPVSHGLTGWHVWAEEAGQAPGELLSILPLSRRGGPPPAPEEREAWACSILAAPDLPVPLDLSVRLDALVTHIAPQDIIHSPFNRGLSQGARRLGYWRPEELFRQLGQALETPAPGRPHFIYAYWPDYDSQAHHHGPDSPRASAALKAFEAGLASFLGAGLDGAALLLTADHGFITAPPERLIRLNDLPELQRLLLRPLSGERRAAYVHLQPGRVEEFAQRARECLGHALWVCPSQDLLEAGWFGQGPRHPRLLSRIGDLTLILKEDWTLKDSLPGEREFPLIGMHGGVSPAERQVPLCLFR